MDWNGILSDIKAKEFDKNINSVKKQVTLKNFVIRKPTLAIEPGIKRTYTSRRSKVFDDCDSCGEADCMSPRLNIEWKNNKNENVILRPN